MRLQNKALFSLFEIAFVLVLLSGVGLYGMYVTQANVSPLNTLQIKSFLHNYDFTPTEKSVIFGENLTNTSITQNWTSILSSFNSSFTNYGIYVGNMSFEKNITMCINNSYTHQRSFSRLFFSNDSMYTSRILRLEVCY